MTVGIAEYEITYEYAEPFYLQWGHTDNCAEYPHKNCLRFEPGSYGLTFDQVSEPPPGAKVAVVHTLDPKAPWVVVDRAKLRLAAGSKVLTPASVALTPKPGPSGALEADVSFTVRATADDAFVVVVSGTRPMRPMFSGEDREISPWAMSGAIWIDANGDGKSLAREVARR